MIPNASTLAAILNDPAIPSDAKPPQLPGRWDVHPDEPSLLLKTNTITHTGKARLAYDVNAALLWSMSAWLWGRGMEARTGMSGTGVGASFPNVTFGYCGSYSEEFPTPVENLAAVVRRVVNSVD